MSSCFGLCDNEKKTPPKSDNFRVIYNKAADTVVIETQTSDHLLHEETHDTLAILDCGSAKIRAGFAGDDTPLINMPTVVGKTIVNEVTKKVFGDAALKSTNDYRISYPVERGFIDDWQHIEDIFEYIFDNHLRIQPKMHELILTEPLNNPTANRERTAEIIFEKFKFNSFLFVPSTPMGMYGHGSSTGVILESGAGQTHILAFKNSDYIKESYRNIPLGGDDLSKYMGQLLTKSGQARYFHEKRNRHEILNEIKRIGCHVALNYEEEIKRLQSNRNLIPHNAILKDGTMIGMTTEAFQVPELLFQPDMIGIQSAGIAQNIYDCIESCDPTLRPQLYENIVLCGGNTMFDGIEDRLLWEVKTFAGPTVNVRINAPHDRENLVFLGASLLSVFPFTRKYLISKQEYEDSGPAVLQWKRI